jgi:membrane peptidoglycan carboxypeptidase
LELTIACDGLTPELVEASLPPPLLGPLPRAGVRGAWDYRLGFRLDLARPDSVDFHADVIPHDLEIDREKSRLNLLTLDQPFLAEIHLPHGRGATRDLSPANPHYRPLEGIDSILVHAVLTNEDGGFYQHSGFNPSAVKGAIADNIRAGAYRRGAGTITMQLARNLYLGHERTLSRKAQEVVLAWILEHLTYVTKRRLLEIYLNVIEWGPGIHGADEAARYYFGRDAGRVTVDQALFLATVLPAPTKWRYRFGDGGAIRPFERAQMHFIGRAMVKKGWLAPASLPAADSLRLEITGPAREMLLPERAAAPDTSAG